jgi:hypothetical protein
VDQQGLAAAEAGLADDRVVRGDERLGDRRGVLERHPVGDFGDRALVGDELLGVAAAAGQAEHAIADREPLDAGPERVDLAGELQARDVGRRVGRRGVGAHALQQVGAVDGRRPHPDPDLPARGLGRGAFDEGEDVGSSWLGDRDRSHAGTIPHERGHHQKGRWTKTACGRCWLSSRPSSRTSVVENPVLFAVLPMFWIVFCSEVRVWSSESLLLRVVLGAAAAPPVTASRSTGVSKFDMTRVLVVYRRSEQPACQA